MNNRRFLQGLESKQQYSGVTDISSHSHVGQPVFFITRVLVQNIKVAPELCNNEAKVKLAKNFHLSKILYHKY